MRPTTTSVERGPSAARRSGLPDHRRVNALFCGLRIRQWVKRPGLVAGPGPGAIAGKRSWRWATPLLTKAVDARWRAPGVSAFDAGAVGLNRGHGMAASFYPMAFSNCAM